MKILNKIKTAVYGCIWEKLDYWLNKHSYKDRQVIIDKAEIIWGYNDFESDKRYMKDGYYHNGAINLKGKADSLHIDEESLKEDIHHSDKYESLRDNTVMKQLLNPTHVPLTAILGLFGGGVLSGLLLSMLFL